MTWQILLFVSILTAGMTLSQRVLMKDQKTDPIALTIVFQLIGGIFIGFFAVLKGFQFPNISLIWFNFLLMPLLWGLANFFVLA